MRVHRRANRVFVFLSVTSLAFVLLAPSSVSAGTPGSRRVLADNPAPPSSPVKLIFIHHSCGENWLEDGNGRLGKALRDNNYFVSDTNYGWGPDGIGDSTDIGHWWTWFRGPKSGTYTSALYRESGQNSSYSRLGTDPGGENRIIMFKSCFPNSDVTGAANPVPPIGANPLRGDSGPLTFANGKGIYIDLLQYFKTRRDKLFIAVTAPPKRSLDDPATARAWNNWLVNDWLKDYPYDNVFVFDFYNVLTSNGGNHNTNDLGRETGNHHRWWNGAIQHKTDGGSNELAYPEGGSDDHPSAAGNRKATAEFLPLLNVAYNRFAGSAPPPPPNPEDYNSVFYFAEGTTRDGFQEYLCIGNPNGAPATAVATYMFEDGTTQNANYEVPANGRATVNVNEAVGAGRNVSVMVGSTTSNLVAERPMYFNYRGEWTGGHDVIGATHLSDEYYFAEGTTRTDFDSYFCIQNPGSRKAEVEITYMLGNGKTRKQALEVPGTSRRTVVVDDFLGSGNDPAHDFSARVESTNGVDILVERPMYFNYNGAWTGGHDVVGSSSLGSTFLFAEGTCRPGFDPYFCIQNPNDEAIDVTIKYMTGSGETRDQEINVPKTSRKTVVVKDFLGVADDAAHDFSARIDSAKGADFLAERPMYFNYRGLWTGGHDVIGEIGPDEPPYVGNSAYLFAEGTCRPGFQSYFCIQNYMDTATEVRITYLLGNGTTMRQSVNVPAFSRATVPVNDFLGTANDPAHDFSAIVQSVDGGSILVERPMYFNYGGTWTGGHDVIGIPYCPT